MKDDFQSYDFISNKQKIKILNNCLFMFSLNFFVSFFLFFLPLPVVEPRQWPMTGHEHGLSLPVSSEVNPCSWLVDGLGRGSSPSISSSTKLVIAEVL